MSLFIRNDNWEEFKLYKVYPVAVGMDEYPTPLGLYAITVKAKNPKWKMPDSPWVPEEDRGKIIDGGDPRNPLIARWMKVIDGVGIHGTNDLPSLGTHASHGCIRMNPPDVIEVYHITPKFSMVRVYD